jgi:hypothetical protein
MNTPRDGFSQPIFAPLLLGIATTLTVAAYWKGLSGPFILDDDANFQILRTWLAGKVSLFGVLNGPGPWINDRSVAMASFAATAAVAGYEPFAFKLWNLGIHLACGLLLFAVLRELLTRDDRFSGAPQFAAAAIASAWLLHPLHASTVLYAVQRMTQLGALFTFLGMWIYLTARQHLICKRTRTAAALLFLAFPLTLLLAVQSKQNAAVLPVLVLLVEVFYFKDARQGRVIRGFHALFIGLPALAALVLFIVKPSFFLYGYAEYDFSPAERLLTQPRVLFDYLKQLVLPDPSLMGVFTDGYQASRGLWSPPATVISMVVLSGISGAAALLRRSMPSAAFGWFFFLAAHFIESVVAPVELYYEHRNYLPSAGILVAIASLLAYGANALAARGLRTARMSAIALSVLVLVLGLQTHGRARVWSDPLILVRSELDAHPTSVRALVNYVGVAQTVGDLRRAYAVTDEAVRTSTSPHRKANALFLRAWLDCYHRRTASIQDVRQAVEMTHHLDLLTFLSLDALAQAVEAGRCGDFGPIQMADALAAVADQATRQPDTLYLKLAARNRAAQLYVGSGAWEQALRPARLGWQSTTPVAGSPMLIEILLVTGRLTEAQQVWTEAINRSRHESDRAVLRAVRTYIDAEAADPGISRRRFERAQQPK